MIIWVCEKLKDVHTGMNEAWVTHTLVRQPPLTSKVSETCLVGCPRSSANSDWDESARGRVCRSSERSGVGGFAEKLWALPLQPSDRDQASYHRLTSGKEDRGIIYIGEASLES